MYDDETAVTHDNDATAVTNMKSENYIKKPATAPAHKNSSFSFFGTPTGTNRNTHNLKFMGNIIDENTVEDDPAFAKERAKYGNKPVVRTANKKNTGKVLIILAIITVILIVTIVLLSRFISPSNRLDKLLSLGDKYLSELRYDDALLAFDDALKIDSENEHAYVGKIKSYIGLKRYDDALNTIDKAIGLFGRTDELAELQKCIFVLKAGKEGLYLGNGAYISPNDSILPEDLTDAFLYYGADTSVMLAGTVKNSSTEPVTGDKLTKISIKADTIFPLDSNTFIKELVDEHLKDKSVKDCWLVLQVYSEENGNQLTEYRYQVINPDYDESLKKSESGEVVSEEVAEASAIDEETETNDEASLEQEEATEDVEEEETPAETELKSNEMGLYLANGSKVPDLGEISLSDLKGAVFNVGKNNAYYAADIYINPYYLDEDPYEQNWAYLGPYKPGSTISMADFVSDFNSYPEYNYLWVTIKNYDDYQNGDYSTGAEFNYRIIR